jgi:hypothetical protein
MPKRRPLEERLWEKVDKNGQVPAHHPELGACWMWTASTSHGYGVIGTGLGKQTRRAHRIVYVLLRGEIGDGLQLDHLCHDPETCTVPENECPHRRCVNPQHLEAVPGRLNYRRGRGWSGRNARKTHCPQGHQYTESNTWRDAISRRYCITCNPNRGAGHRNSRKTHCPEGHPYAGDTLYIDPRGNRQCKICRRAAVRRAQQRNIGKVTPPLAA